MSSLYERMAFGESSTPKVICHEEDCEQPATGRTVGIPLCDRHREIMLGTAVEPAVFAIQQAGRNLVFLRQALAEWGGSRWDAPPALLRAFPAAVAALTEIEDHLPLPQGRHAGDWAE